jgi:hypothetical protein
MIECAKFQAGQRSCEETRELPRAGTRPRAADESSPSSRFRGCAFRVKRFCWMICKHRSQMRENLFATGHVDLSTYSGEK